METIEVNGKVYKSEDNAKTYEWYKNTDEKKNDVYHLMRNGVEIANGDFVCSYLNRDYQWGKDGVVYRMTENEKVLLVNDKVYKLT